MSGSQIGEETDITPRKRRLFSMAWLPLASLQSAGSRLNSGKTPAKGHRVRSLLTITAVVGLLVSALLLLDHLASVRWRYSFAVLADTFLSWSATIAITAIAVAFIWRMRSLPGRYLATFLFTISAAATLFCSTEYVPGISTFVGYETFPVQKIVFIACTLPVATLLGALQAATVQHRCIELASKVREIRGSHIRTFLKNLI